MSVELVISMDDTIGGITLDKPSWSKISQDELRKCSYENVNWEYSSDSLSVEEMWTELHGKLQDITSCCCPDYLQSTVMVGL